MTDPAPKGARGAKREAMAEFNRLVTRTPGRHCRDKPIPYTEIRQTAAQAAELCGAGEEWECPILAACHAEGRRTKPDAIVLGGKFWVNGKPLPTI